MRRYCRIAVMKRFSHMIGEQLGNPQGLLGKLVGRMLAKNNASFNSWIVHLLSIQPTDHILEVGSGPGLAIQGLATHAAQGFVVGIDSSPIMVQQARRRNASAIKAGRVEIQQGDALTLPYADASFDKVVAVHVIYFWSDAVATLQELRRVLQPAGVVATGFRIKQHIPRWTQNAFAQTGTRLYLAAEDVATLLAASGFTHIEVVAQQVSDDTAGYCALGRK